LMDDGTKFFEYFRMSENSFNLLLSKLEIHLKKQDTYWRKIMYFLPVVSISSAILLQIVFL
jgi:hypothetical protein